MLFLLACANAMQGDIGAHLEIATRALRIESVADVAPAGLVVAAIGLHLLRYRSMRVADRALVLLFGALAGALGGTIYGLELRVTALGLFTVPLFAFVLAFLETEAELSRPRRLRERVWPVNLRADTTTRR